MSYEASMFISSLLTVRAASARILILRIMSTIVNTAELSGSWKRWTINALCHNINNIPFLDPTGSLAFKLLVGFWLLGFFLA